MQIVGAAQHIDSYQLQAEVYEDCTEIKGLPDRVMDAQNDTVWQDTFAA